MIDAMMNFSKKAMERPDFFIRCQRDLEDAVPELVTEVKNKFLVPRTAKQIRNLSGRDLILNFLMI